MLRIFLFKNILIFLDEQIKASYIRISLLLSFILWNMVLKFYTQFCLLNQNALVLFSALLIVIKTKIQALNIIFHHKKKDIQ